MENKKIVLAGGTGFIGRYLEKKFRDSGYGVLIVARHGDHVRWENQQALTAALENTGMLINLAGKSVDCRYSAKNKREILNSRTATTKMLGEAILNCANPPRLWINAGTSTIYRHAEDRPMTETNGEIGNSFSEEVAKKWEQSFFSFQLPHTRQIVLRTAIVLGRNAGAMAPLSKLVRLGFGGRQGSGKQMVSWIHIADLYRIIVFLQLHPKLEGVFNCAAPNPVHNRNFMSALRTAMHVRVGLPLPVWLLQFGAFIIRTEPELILKSRWVLPERLTEAGFRFTYPTCEEAFRSITSRNAAREDS